MARLIHPSAIVSPSASLGADVEVGPYAIIEDDVEIGDGCHIDAHTVIRPFVIMGKGNRILPNSVIGGLPQDTGFDPNHRTEVLIGDNNVFREGVTVNRATTPGSATRIGSDCYFMNNSHVAHDCVVGDRVIFASDVAIGGFVEIGDRAFLGGGAKVHQYCRIGAVVMVSGTVGVLQDVIPYTMAGDSPARHYRLNIVGLKRAGVSGDRYKLLSQAFRRLKNRETLDGLPDSPEMSYLRTWISSPSKRGISSFLSRS
ncbi:MAG: acyl-ACP--UDP-N-acetylglucosamine O-acyltransferase [Methylococcaceae bacterium]|nr:acyl-ACP--UDP-N-acetylglucosamine O-acyltransferase [Methylococcaceae bacterium]MCI0667108.1 acyl-ACP--UDP-N-acetylglucosamine O-acyltransferase [Methylococcaceae bacterium]MCI0733322.1 acyl-ACP--UDP-N-acetylglucosamine O-acyltransferase [Methylococcaceae bacterium]